MIDDVYTYLRMFATSQRHLTHAAAIADNLAATTTLDSSSIAGIALAESAAVSDGDLGILNFALTLEHFENALYRVLLKSGLLTGKALAFAHSFGAHESAHVDALTKTISQLGGTPVKEQAAYNFPKLKTEAAVIATLAQVEDVGASAYLGAAPLLQNADLLTVAVQIHTVEAEHATGFRFLNGQNPVPFAFAPPRTKQEVLAIVTPFLQAPANMPNQMPDTGLAENNTLKVLGVAGGIGAIAAGLALSRSRPVEATEQE
jgi:hypothetical protein